MINRCFKKIIFIENIYFSDILYQSLAPKERTLYVLSIKGIQTKRINREKILLISFAANLCVYVCGCVCVCVWLGVLVDLLSSQARGGTINGMIIIYLQGKGMGSISTLDGLG